MLVKVGSQAGSHPVVDSPLQNQLIQVTCKPTVDRCSASPSAPRGASTHECSCQQACKASPCMAHAHSHTCKHMKAVQAQGSSVPTLE